jgi:hypothetical protein
MKFIIYYTLFILSPMVSPAVLASACGSISYTPFEALLYGAENEESIVTDAFHKRWTSDEKFKNILIEKFSNKPSGYNSRDTRAVVVIGNNT